MSRVIAPERFYQVGGTLSADAPSYVQRKADRELVEHTAAGDFSYVLMPRQMGKSSLMVHAAAQLQKRRIRSVTIDLQGMIEQGMAAEAFYAGLVDTIIRELKLPVKLEQWWHEHALLSAVQRFSDFVSGQVLPRVRKGLVVFIDEIDSTLSLGFSDDFFAAIRAFYNERARNPAFKRLTFVLLGVASPQDLIKDRARSPFNIGHRIELTDFTIEEARKLAEGFPVNGEAAERLLERIVDWTGGHPYLSQRVCTSLATDAHLNRGERRVDEIIDTLFFSDATWSDPNLANVRDRIIEDKAYSDVLLDLYRRIFSGELVYDDERSPVHIRLKLSGIVKVAPGGVLRPRNRIYERVFDRAWIDTVLRSQASRRVTTRLDPETLTLEVPTTLTAHEQAQIDKLHQAITGLEAQQRELGLDFTRQIAELRRRLQEMGDLWQRSSGALATPGGVAAGAGGVAVGGDVHGNIYTGPPIRGAAEALAIYLRMLVEGCRDLPLRGFDVGASDPSRGHKPLDLVHVYVSLNVISQGRSEDEATRKGENDILLQAAYALLLSALKAVTTYRRVVLLGDPGAGKSTFISHLALCLAAYGVDPQDEWLARLPGWPEEEANLVPIVVVLRDFARWLGRGVKKAEPRHLWNFIVACLKAQNLAFVAEPLHERLEHGQAILLLDALDEIPTRQQRTFIRDAVTAFATRYSQCRFVVTCRTHSYQDPDWQLVDFQSFTLAPFSEDEIDRFIAAWHGELARLGTIKPGTVEGATRQLQAAVRRPDLWRLASNPLLLTVMALVHTHKGRLPEARALLYEETVDILLWRWEEVKASGEDEAPLLRQLLAQADRTDVDLKRALWRLAFEAQQASGTADTEAVADIGELRLNKALVELHPDKSRDWAHHVVEVMKQRAGLLLERAPEVYTFPHRTFQEYLAGAHLSTQPDFAQQGSRLVAEGSFWREVVLLAVGRLVYLNGETAKPLALVAELCPSSPVDTDAAWRQAWLAGDVLLEMGLNRVGESALGRELAERVRHRLVALVRGGDVSPVERAAVGDTMARLGDPRFRADAWYLPDEPLLGLVEIPEGPFVMGSNYTTPKLGEDCEMPQHEITLPRYYIARYPVTVEQFRVFLRESGYKPTGGGWLRGLSNYPVVHVSWYDAIAYCRWITERLREWEGVPAELANLLRHEGWCVTLPSEAEWEKAARGMDGRKYPWGNVLGPHWADFLKIPTTETRAVGCFPRGASPYQIQEMNQTVSEWTRTLWGETAPESAYRYPYDPADGRENLQAPDRVLRVLRGAGRWHCAVRGATRPIYSSHDVGFRVVVRPCL